LLTADFEAKISDFGLARTPQFEAGKSLRNVGPVKWMAPECFTNHEYSKKTDVWSFGVLLVEIFTRKPPFPEMAPVDVATKIIKCELQPSLQNVDTAPPMMMYLVQKCCQFDPEKRLDFPGIVAQLVVH